MEVGLADGITPIDMPAVESELEQAKVASASEPPLVAEPARVPHLDAAVAHEPATRVRLLPLFAALIAGLGLGAGAMYVWLPTWLAARGTARASSQAVAPALAQHAEPALSIVEALAVESTAALGIVTQNLENPLLRKQLGLTGTESGVMITQIDHGASSHGVLEIRDVVLAIDGLPIANNGTVQYLTKHRTRFDVALTGRYVGDTVGLTIHRAGARHDVTVTLKPWMPLVPRARYDQPPVYFLYGGLVFQPLTRDFLTTWDKWWNKAPKEFLFHYYSGQRTADRHEVVILTQILADEINQGYAHLYNEGVVSVNGAMPLDMNDFVARVLGATGILEIQTSSGGVIMLDTTEVRTATARILERYRIPRDRSLGLPA